MSITDELRRFAKGWVKLLAIADRIDEALHERYIELLKDADGEYIHPKDMLTDGKNVYTVTTITFNSCGLIVFGHSDNNLNEWPIDEVSKLHHLHEMTVEDVLAEFALEIDPSADIAVTGAETIKKFAAKLQLKEIE